MYEEVMYVDESFEQLIIPFPNMKVAMYQSSTIVSITTIQSSIEKEV